MEQSKIINFQGVDYFDDRIYVFYLCPGTVEIRDDDMVATTIYHEKASAEHIWCVVIYKNTHRYPLYQIYHFYKQADAIDFLQRNEPKSSLISLGGQSPTQQMSYEKYCQWKKGNGLKDYDWKSIYLPGGSNAQESIYQTKEQFDGIR